jgi:hypothetical protein
MKSVRLGLLVAILVCWAVSVNARPELPAAAREVLTQLESEASDLDRKTDAEMVKCRERGVAELKKAQDDLTRQGKLDEATAVRELIRIVEQGGPVALYPTTPGVVRRTYRQYEEEAAALYEKAEEAFLKRREKAVAELKKIQEAFCKEAKLDDALAVRDQIRVLTSGKIVALPDPGFVNHQPMDLGKSFYYEVTGLGAAGGQAIYGTDVYVIGSHLGTAAVHCGALKEGEKGVVRVTIVPGHDSFASTVRNGITSQPYGRAEPAFKVERAYGWQFKSFVDTLPIRKAYEGGVKDGETKKDK